MIRPRAFSILIFSASLLVGTTAVAQSERRAQLEMDIQSLRDQLRVKEKQFLAPSSEDKSAYAEFLKQPMTGLVRLLPREKYDSKLTIRGGGAYYSFTRLTHEYGYGSDIGLEQKGFQVGFAGADFGFLTMLEGVALEEVTLDHPAVQYLAMFSAPSKEPEARVQQQRASAGFKVGNFTYKNNLMAIVGFTYIVRSVQYGEADVLAAFRVVREDSDGSLILIWKILKKFPTPQFTE